MESADKPTIEEVTESLTGFDEIAIEKHFHIDWMKIAEEKPTFLPRCLLFVLRRREGMNDPDAYNAVMGMSLKDTNDVFVDDAELDPDDPETPSGKGAGSRDSEPVTSPPSA